MGIILGVSKPVLNRNSDRHREYKITYKVEVPINLGPANALLTAGLPVPGSIWRYKSEFDSWAFCLFDASVTAEDDRETTGIWNIEFTYSTKPPDIRSCKDVQVEDPLLEPAKISGTEESSFPRSST